MSFPRPQPALFLHIQKTAGTSVVQSLADHYKGSYTSHLDYYHLTDQQASEQLLLSGHFGFRYAAQFMDDRFSFTFLRDPRERILSFYRYCLSCDPATYEIYAITRACSLNEFLDRGASDPKVMPFVWNHQAWQLAHGWSNQPGPRLLDYTAAELSRLSLQNMSRFDFVGITKDLDKDLLWIRNRLGISSSYIPVWINSTQNATRPVDLPSHTQSKLDKLVEADDQLYQAAVSAAAGRGHSLKQ